MNKNLIALSVCLPLLGACSHPKAEPEETAKQLFLTDSLRQVVSLDTTRVTALSNELILNGRVTFDPGKVAHVYPAFGGTITDVHVEIGDQVRKGDVLAVIRSSEVAEYDKQKKEAAQALLVARRNLDAVQDMFRSGISSERDLLLAKQALADAEAEQKRMEEVSSIYNLSGSSVYTVKAPVSGFVVDKHISRNMQIRSDQADELFTISGLEEVWVLADVYEGDISKVKEGAPVRITTLAYGDMEFAGTIDKVYNILDDESKTMSVRIRLTNDGYLLKPGMFTNVSVQCKVAGKEMPCIDSRALIFEDGKHYVVQVLKDGVLALKQVSVFRQTEEQGYIMSGLENGDVVVGNNALLVYNALK